MRLYVVTGRFPGDPEQAADLRDVLVLQRHPGWTWRDLQDTPQRFIDLENALLAAQGRRRERDSQRTP